jgi:hypothetical protein
LKLPVPKENVVSDGEGTGVETAAEFVRGSFSENTDVRESMSKPPLDEGARGRG